MAWIENLFTLNERVVYYGNWMHGFFSMTAVGATNVGSIKCYFDQVVLVDRLPRVTRINLWLLFQKLRTNLLRQRIGNYYDLKFDENINKAKGDAFGEFNLGRRKLLCRYKYPTLLLNPRSFAGSTIVLIFEAPDDVEFCVDYGQRVKYGQKLFSHVHKKEQKR